MNSSMDQYKSRIQHVKGSPFEIGCALGRSLGPRLEANIARYIRERVPQDVRLNLETWRSGALPWLRSLPARFLEEFEGLAEGSGLPLQRLAEWAYLEIVLAGQCSGAIITIDQRAWVARNNDMFAPGMWGYVVIREVSGRIPTISFGMEGDVFTPTGINQDKLWLHYNYLPTWDTPAAGKLHLPCYALLVEALETCRTLPDLEALLQRIQRDDGMLLFAVDGKTNAFVLYECTCTEVYKRESSNGWIVGTNHYCVHPKAPLPNQTGPLSTANRYKQIETLAGNLYARHTPASPVRELMQILADDAIEARRGEIVTACSNVACPSTQEIWYTFGGYPAASHGNWQRLAWPW
jgi:hypothetical protein